MGKVRVNEYILKSPKIKENKVLINITDTHGNIQTLNDILETLKEIKTNYICMPGDIIDNLEQPNQEEFTESLKKLNEVAKTYISLGNHDTMHENKQKDDIDNIKETDFYKYMKDFKGKLFVDRINKIDINNNITIHSINLPKEYYMSHDSMEEFNKFIDSIDIEVDKNKFNILLMHSPNGITRKNEILNNKLTESMDLILCGHNHGGLTPVFVQDLFNNHLGLVGPYSSFFQNNAYGIWHDNKTSVLVSNGAVKVSDTSRYKELHDFIKLFFKPEIDLIHINQSEKSEFYLDKRKIYKI